MSTIAERLNNAAIRTKKYTNFDKLPLGVHYIREFKLSKSKFGVRLEATLSGGTAITLPDRFYDEFSTQEDVDSLNLTKKILTYKGKDRFNNNRVNVSISEADDCQQQGKQEA